MNLRLDTSIQYVPRVGPAMASRLKKLEIRTVRDLLYYVPFRYNDFSQTVSINRIVPNTTVTIEGDVQSMRNVFTKTGKKFQEAVVGDPSGYLTVVWFNQIYLPKVIHPGDRISLSGKIGFFGNKLVMESPAYELLGNEEQELLHTGRLVPVYSETAGVTSKWLRGRVAYLLTLKNQLLEDPLPQIIREQHGLMGLIDAITASHFPNNYSESENGRRRLGFDELFFLQLQSQHRKQEWQEKEHGPVFLVKEEDIRQFLKNLPFTLTNDQQKVIQHICADVKRTYPMNRLLEGDVGSGKTVVAALGMYLAFKNGYTSVMMAPTQILAEQHFSTIQQLLKPFNIPVSLVMGNMKKKTEDRKQKTEKVSHPSSVLRPPSSIIIGTHALLQERIQLNHVGLVVVDEQQRFGVAQRKIIRNKGTTGITPHFLTMTATPIPRTLALTVYGNLDLSVLTEMPKGRMQVKTWVVPQEKRENAYAWIRKELEKFDCRAFIICPFIEESESLLSVKAVKKEYDRLTLGTFRDIPLGLLHGKMKPKEKTGALADFKEGKTKILVSTPVVEVGIDIPEATIMLIEGADRFGLSQLHQLRGRVGRGNLKSYCLLFTENTDEKTLERLKVLEKVKNGPELSEYDLNLRGEGDIFGMKQHGLPTLTLTSLKDRELVEETQQAVHLIMDEDPKLSHFPLLREHLEKGTIGEGIQD
jgi:ATP-dependent DNA helicase RecG